MSKFIFFFILAFSFNTFAEFQVESRWNNNNEKEVVLTCDMDSMMMCMSTCLDSYECVIPEDICYNCVGNDLFLVNFYKNIGLSIRSTFYFVPHLQLRELLRQENFITLKANSIYNIISDYNSKSMQKKFDALCPEVGEYEPLVFVRVDDERKPIELKFVACGSDLFEMTDQILN